MKYIETILAFIVLTSTTIITVSALKVLGEVNMKRDVVAPIVALNVR
jgi:hypothetical protein